MSVLDLNNGAQDHEHVSACYCVIGASLAGLTLAVRLADAGHRVVVLESGNGWPDLAALNSRIMDDVPGHTDHMGGFSATLRDSVPWAGRLLPMSAFEASRRDHVGLPGWPLPLEALTPYYRDAGKLLGIEPASSAQSPQLGRGNIGPQDDADFHMHTPALPKTGELSLSALFGRQVRTSANIELWLNAGIRTFDVDPESGRLRSIIAGNAFGRRLSVLADHVVFATGTIATTRLLLWLDASTRGQAFARTPALGLYLQKHINVRVARVQSRNGALAKYLCADRLHHNQGRSLHLDLTSSAQRSAGTASAFAHIVPSADQTKSHFDRRSNSRARLLARNFPFVSRKAWDENRGCVEAYVELCAEQVPDERNYVEISGEQDAFGIPKVRMQWRAMAADEHTLRQAADRLAAYWSRHDLDSLLPLEWAEACCDATGKISDAATGYHNPSGTARMGTNRNSSVVGPDLVCHDIANLSVVSAAVFPTSGSVNPAFTLVALAMRHADALLAKRPRSLQRSRTSKAKIPSAPALA